MTTAVVRPRPSSGRCPCTASVELKDADPFVMRAAQPCHPSHVGDVERWHSHRAAEFDGTRGGGIDITRTEVDVPMRRHLCRHVDTDRLAAGHDGAFHFELLVRGLWTVLLRPTED